MSSRLGVVKWIPSDQNFDNFTAKISNSSYHQGMFVSTMASEQWIQADVLISICVITMLTVRFCHTTQSGMSALLALASLLITLLLGPVTCTILLLFACYRRLVSGILRLLVGSKYAGLLYGTDACWAFEEDTSLSIINVLALADFSFIVSASTEGEEPLQTISELIQDRLLINSSFAKLFCHRLQSRLGYFYWLKQDSINVSDHINWMDIEDEGDQTITEETLKNYISSAINTPLPNNHKTGWEILVGRYPIKPSSDLFDAMENGSWTTKSCAGVRYPVLFRVHHSVGDGVALVNLFLDSLGDPFTRCNTPAVNLRSSMSTPTFESNFERPRSPSMREEFDESPKILSWEESDTPKYNKSLSCDFKSTYVDIPSQQSCVSFKKSKTCDFVESKLHSKNEYDNKDFRYSIKTACKNILNFMDETAVFKNKLSEKSIEDFNIVVNNRPGGEFLELINNATKLESQYKCLTKHSDKKTDNKLKFVLENAKVGVFMFAKVIFMLIEYLKSHSKQWSVLMFAPLALLNQVLTQTKDVNLLHGPRLSGHKVVAWYLEQQDNPDQLLMEMIKRIRSKTGVRFSDVLLTALSASLEAFYAQSNEIPQFITVVIPAKIGSPIQVQASTTVIKSKNFSTKVTKIIESSEDSKLQNTFSIAMLPLPIANSSTTKLKVFCKLRQVRKHCDVLRRSPDYLVNYWLLRVVATLVPSWFLRPLLKSTHSTLVMSNLPGPTRLTKLAGHTVHDLVFWVPNRTTTGVGVTVLSYAGRLQLGLMADRALIACQQDAQLIVDGVAAAIQQMDQISSPQS